MGFLEGEFDPSLVKQLVHLLLYAFVQGIGEAFPISSSGHLSLISKLLSFPPSQALRYAVAAHSGSLCALVFFFRHEWAELIYPWVRRNSQAVFVPRSKRVFALVITREHARHWLLCIGMSTLPVVLGGGFLYPLLRSTFTELPLVALGFFLTAITLCVLFFYEVINVSYQGDRLKLSFAPRRRSLDDTTRKMLPSMTTALLIGCAQVLAVFPGVSRLALTMTAGILLKMSPRTSATYSFLIAMPIMAGAFLLEVRSVPLTPPFSLLLEMFIIAGCSMVVTFFALRLFFRVFMEKAFFLIIGYLGCVAVLTFLVSQYSQ